MLLCTIKLILSKQTISILKHNAITANTKALKQTQYCYSKQNTNTTNNKTVFNLLLLKIKNVATKCYNKY